jgi:hypothetical protein
MTTRFGSIADAKKIQIVPVATGAPIMPSEEPILCHTRRGAETTMKGRRRGGDSDEAWHRHRYRPQMDWPTPLRTTAVDDEADGTVPSVAAAKVAAIDRQALLFTADRGWYSSKAPASERDVSRLDGHTW